MPNTGTGVTRTEALEMLSGQVTGIADRAAPVFEAHGWTYGAPGGMEVPDSWRLTATLFNLINSALTRPEAKVIECGRFRLDIESYDEDGPNEHWAASLTLHI